MHVVWIQKHYNNEKLYSKRSPGIADVKVEKKKMTQLKLRSETIFILINLLKDLTLK